MLMSVVLWQNQKINQSNWRMREINAFRWCTSMRRWFNINCRQDGNHDYSRNEFPQTNEFLFNPSKWISINCYRSIQTHCLRRKETCHQISQLQNCFDICARAVFFWLFAIRYLLSWLSQLFFDQWKRLPLDYLSYAPIHAGQHVAISDKIDFRQRKGIGSGTSSEW